MHSKTLGLPCSMVLHDNSMAAPLRLIWAGLDLHRPPFAPPPYSVEGSASPEAPQTDAFTTSRGDGMPKNPLCCGSPHSFLFSWHGRRQLGCLGSQMIMLNCEHHLASPMH